MATKRELRGKGYQFLGAYSRDKNEMKERAKKERAKGNRAVVVTEESGYSVYVLKSPARFRDDQREADIAKVHRLVQDRQRVLDVLKEIDAQLTALSF